MTDKIEFGAGFTAELRDYSYYITHPNGGGAMAGTAEAALLQALAAVRAERDFARGERDAYRHERDTLASALEEVSKMADSVAIWAFVREVLQEVMGGPQ